MFVSKIGEISFHMLKNNFVDIYTAEEGTPVSKIIEMHKLNQLDKIDQPTHLAEKSKFAMSRNIK